MARLRLEPELLHAVAGHPLFYPCSGQDFTLPIKLFSPHVTEFWFVDITYFRRPPAEQAEAVMATQPDYVLLNVEIRLPNIPEADWRMDKKYEGRSPVIRTETYRHAASEKIVRVHRHMRRGPSALRSEIERLGVFFYRGDSLGEGGSGTEWLTVWDQRYGKHHSRAWLIEEVLNKIVDGGLIITDGGNCRGDNNPYAELGRFHRNVDISCAEVVRSARPFEDLFGRKFRCVGCIGHHYQYGPGLIWQVSTGPRNDEDTENRRTAHNNGTEVL